MLIYIIRATDVPIRSSYLEQFGDYLASKDDAAAGKLGAY
jgi:hypothetical protein